MTAAPISVLMPARNAAGTVGRAVASTLRAMRRDDELLVLDDGSTDGSAAELARHADARLRVITNRDGGGVARGLQRLLGEARHDVVARMDADDVTLPGRFRLQSAALGRADVAFGNLVLFGAVRPTIVPTTLLPLSGDAMALWLLLENPVAHSTMIARKRALQQVGGYRVCPAEDYDLWLRAAAAGLRVRRSGTPVIAYRLHPGQVSTSTEYRDALADDPVLESAWRELLAVRGYRDAATATLRDRTDPASAVRRWLAGRIERLPVPQRAVMTRRLGQLS